MTTIGCIMNAMIAYNGGDPRRIHHFLKVYGFAKAIGEGEGLKSSDQEILELAALTHDIGIRNSERKFHSTAGPLQETEGPPEAEQLLSREGINPQVIQRVCWLIGHHHTYTDIKGMDYQILVEADFLVNALEDQLSPDAIAQFGKKVFKTDSGKRLLQILYFS